MDWKRIVDVADRALSKIPGDGKKTTSGAGLLVIGKMLSLIPGLEFLGVPGVVEAIGAVIGAVGIAHKLIKKAIQAQ